MPSLSGRVGRVPARVLALVAAFVCGIGAAADIGRVPIATIRHLHELAQSGERLAYPVHLEAVVLAADQAGKFVILQDVPGRGEAARDGGTRHTGEAAAQFQTDLDGVLLRAGDRVVVEGQCHMADGELTLGRSPLVDNDGHHPPQERSGSIWLSAGLHPVELLWFNARGDSALEVFYTGPGIAKTNIPAAALFRQEIEGGRTNWVNGVDWFAHEGVWKRLPDLRSLAPLTNGISTNFTRSVATRPKDAGVLFKGWVSIPTDGTYSFTTLSDDGSLLYLDSGRVQFQVVATNALPQPRRLVAGTPVGIEADCQWVEAEGKVTFAGQKEGGLEMELAGPAGKLTAFIPHAQEAWSPLLIHSHVRVTGICRCVTSLGEENAARRSDAPYAESGAWVMVPTPSMIQVVAVPAETWSAYPVTTVGAFTDEIVQGEAGRLQSGGTALAGESLNGKATRTRIVRLRGDLRRVAGRTEFADKSGTLALETLASSAAGELELLLDAEVGRALRRAPSTGPLAARYAIARPAAANGAGLPLLTTIEQIHRLKRDEAAKAYPVRIRGVVTCAFDSSANGMVQDDTRGIFVPDISAGGEASHPGDILEIEGYTAPGSFAPILQAQRARRIGTGKLPEPIRPTWDQLNTGSEDVQYVELEGIVTSVQTNGCTLLMRGGRMHLEMDRFDSNALAAAENARVRMRGCLSAQWDGQTHQVRSGELLLHTPSISIEEPAPANLFATQRKDMTELKRFDANGGTLQRVRLTGQIIHGHDGEYIIMDGTNGARIILKKNIAFAAGDIIEAVGFPDLDGLSPVLRDAVAYRTGTGRLSAARFLSPDDLLNPAHDATLVTIEATLLAMQTKNTEQTLDLQAGWRTFIARLPATAGVIPDMPPGSRLRITGAYVGHGSESGVDSFELHLNTVESVLLIARPPWWTARRTFLACAILVAVLLLAVGWIGSLRRQVDARTAQLTNERDQHLNTARELEKKAALLAAEIDERTRAEQEVERVHKQLLRTSRQVGMAEVATSVLHNVGNVLNSVNVSASLLADNVRQTRTVTLSKLADLLAEHSSEPDFLSRHPKGKTVPGYVKQLADLLSEQKERNLAELKSLQTNIEHINNIISMQQNYARIGGIVEKTKVSDIVEDAIRLVAAAVSRHGIELVREFHIDPEIEVEKHKVLQILVNLLQNAKNACVDAKSNNPKIVVTIQQSDPSTIQVHIRDNGVGIPGENLARLFTQGFTTRSDGHGFGLHGCIIAAREMNASLRAHSDGPGRGALFILELPVESTRSDECREELQTVA